MRIVTDIFFSDENRQKSCILEGVWWLGCVCVGGGVGGGGGPDRIFISFLFEVFSHK